MSDGDVVAEVIASKRVTEEQVLRLRRAVYNDGMAEAGELERLFVIDEAATEHDPSWQVFFVEAVTDYIVNQVQPQGYISEANADWLMARISRDGSVKTATELELLVKVLEKAQSSPERLSAFALSQVKQAVVHGEGPLANGRALTPGRVGEAEAELMRRVLYAFGGDGNIAITRAEAEILFDINDASATAENHPAWNDLFVKAVANFMMAASGYAVPGAPGGAAARGVARRADRRRGGHFRPHGGGRAQGLSPRLPGAGAGRLGRAQRPLRGQGG